MKYACWYRRWTAGFSTRTVAFWALAAGLTLAAGGSAKAAPTAEDALKVMPIQKGVRIAKPTAEEARQCTLKMEKVGSASGWVVRDGGGRLLRRFLDTNGDNKLDQWHYFRNEILVYQDIDSDFNRKADQYRWLGSEGTRWGVDSDEDGRIDRWKRISAEEVSLVVVEALQNADAELFRTVLLTQEELRELPLGRGHRDGIAVRIRNAGKNFESMAESQETVTETTRWLHFGGSRPGWVLNDELEGEGVEVYDNVAAIVDNEGSHQQIDLGSLVRVGDAWKVIDTPRNLGESQVAADGFFFHESSQERNLAATTAPGAADRLQELIAQLEKIDRDLNETSSATAQAQLQAERAEVIEKLANATAGEDRQIWLRQFADTVSSAAQSGAYPDGVQRLKQLDETLASDGEDKAIRAYVRFRYLTAQYGLALQDPKVDYAKVQSEWMENLESFSERFPNTPDAGEAMLQLAIAKEFAGEDEAALKWYGKIEQAFAGKLIAEKAAGAQKRIRSIGKSIDFQGQSTEGRTVDLAEHRGDVVVLHYWASWCGQDLPILKDINARYANRDLVMIGVNVDNQRDDMEQFLRSNRLAWTQLHSQDGIDGELATQLGVLTPPTIFLIDKQGRVIRNDLHARELDAELKKLLP